MKNTEKAEAEVENQGCCHACVNPVSSAHNSKCNINCNKFFGAYVSVYLSYFGMGVYWWRKPGPPYLKHMFGVPPYAFLTLPPSFLPSFQSLSPHPPTHFFWDSVFCRSDWPFLLMLWLRMTLYDLYHLSARITGMSHHAQSIQCWAGTQGFLYNRQANTESHSQPLSCFF